MTRKTGQNSHGHRTRNLLLAPAFLLVFLMNPSGHAGRAQAQSNPGRFVLEAVEQKMTTGDTQLNRDIFPELSGGIALSPGSEKDPGEYHYQLAAVPPEKRAEVEKRLEALKKSPLYGMTKVKYFGQSKTKPIFMNQAFFTRALPVPESHCNCIKTFPFKVFGYPPQTPLGYGCFFEYPKPGYLVWTWPGDEPRSPGDRGTIKAPIYWGYDLCREDVQEILVECSLELSRHGIPMDRENYRAQPIAVRTADTLYLVKETPGPFPEDIKDCGMETKSAIHGFPAFRIKDSDDENLADKIMADTLKSLVETFGESPLDAEPDVTLSDEAVLTRFGQKSDLLDGQYESAGYRVRVYRDASSVYINIRYHIMAADRADGSFHPPSEKEMARYVKTIEETVMTARERVLKAYEGRVETDVSEESP